METSKNKHSTIKWVLFSICIGAFLLAIAINAIAVDPEPIAEKPKKSLSPKAELDSLKKELADYSAFDKAPSPALYETYMLMFKEASTLIKKGIDSKDAEATKRAESLKAKLTKYQIKWLPAIRKDAAKKITEKLWENDIDVALGGKGNTTLTFKGIYFALNKNIKEAQITLHDILKLYRFKRAEYYSSKYDDEYTYYAIESQEDGELYE